MAGADSVENLDSCCSGVECWVQPCATAGPPLSMRVIESQLAIPSPAPNPSQAGDAAYNKCAGCSTAEARVARLAKRV